MRLIVHAGFHKTGTTSVQKMLRKNKRKLSHDLRLFTRPQMIPVCEAARAYSIQRSPMDLALLAYEWAQFLQSLPPDDPRPVLVSSEDLSGHMPGRHGLTGYDAAPALMKCLVDTAKECFQAPDITLFFSTRAPVAWVRSCYAHHLRSTRITESRTEYEQHALPRGDLIHYVRAVRAAVPGIAVHHAALEATTKRRLGPLSPLLDLADVPSERRRKLIVVPPANVARKEGILQKLLHLNQSDLTDDALSTAKKQVLRSDPDGPEQNR